METFFGDLSQISIITRLVIVFIVAGFIPLSAMTFFWFMISRKRRSYEKSMREMGINSSRKVMDTFSPYKFILPVSFAFIVCLLAVSYFTFADVFIAELNDSLLLAGPFFGEGKNQGIIYQSLYVLQYAFYGGFLWSARNIIRRIIAFDLLPSVYYSAGLRILLASLVALMLAFLLGDESTSGFVSLKNSMPALAFLTGMFPERIISYLMRQYKRFVAEDSVTARYLGLYTIEGMSIQHKERLEEIGIDNAQNLAEASLTQLLIETPFEARQLIDWIGQAKLICYTKEHIDGFRNMGIRSVFDFFKGNKTLEQLRSAAHVVGLPLPLVENVYQQCTDDRGITALFHFQQGVNAPDERKVAPEDVKGK